MRQKTWLPFVYVRGYMRKYSSFTERYQEQIRQLSESMRKRTMPETTEELFALFETTGNRLQYEDVYFERRKFLAIFGMASILFGRKEDKEKLEEIIGSVCAEECWALPAHVNRAWDGNWRVTVDLFACETAQTLAELVSLTEVSKETYHLVRQEIERRVFTPFFSSEPNYGCWECGDHNWNAVCAGSIGSACLYLMQEDEKRLENCLKRICHSLEFYLNGFREDGACMEGVGYFTYGMTYYVGFAEQLLRYTNGKNDLFANEKLRKIAEFQQKMYFSGGRTVSFSDGDQQAKFRMGLTSYLAERYESVQVPREKLAAEFETDPCYRFMGLCRDYFWTKNAKEKQEADSRQKEEVLQTEQVSRHDVLSFAQWSICESRNGVGFAVKGGTNAEPHNHNDVGSFCYLVREEFLLTDLGAGEYTRDYFGEGRYGILCNSSEGHNVPILSGHLQQAGENYRASEFTADGKGKTAVEFAGAYPAGVAKRLYRTCEFSPDTGILAVTDEIEFAKTNDAKRLMQNITEKVTFTEQLVTQGSVELFAHGIRIQGEKNACTVSLPETIQNLRTEEREFSNHAGQKEPVILIRFEVPVNQDNKGVSHCSIQFQIIPEES